MHQNLTREIAKMMIIIPSTRVVILQYQLQWSIKRTNDVYGWNVKKQEAGSEFNIPRRPIKCHFSDCTGEVDYFLKYVGIWERILFETNLYANQEHCPVSSVTNNDTRFQCPSGFQCIVQETIPTSFDKLALNDNQAMPRDNADKLYKMRPFVWCSKQKFHDVVQYQWTCKHQWKHDLIQG